MSFSLADQRRVFLACRPIFTGSHAQMRREKVVRKVVVKRRQVLKQLLTDFGENKVVEILRYLLERRIFESDHQARAHFPELFFSSPAQNIQRAESESDAARSVAELLDEIESSEGHMEYTDTEQKTDIDGEKTASLPENRTQGLLATHEVLPEVLRRSNVETHSTLPPRTLPNLYPPYLSYSTQHRILTITQNTLEESCFEFAQKWLPSVLAAQHWDCAAAVELTRWSKVFKQHSNEIPGEAITLVNDASLSQVLLETHRLRHAAVHRLPTTAREVSKFILAALHLSQALQDTRRMSQFDELYHEVEEQIKAMELHKNALEDNLRLDLESIAAKRKELDRQERERIQSMLSADQDNKMLIASLLDEAVQRLFDPNATAEDLFESCSDEEGTQVPETPSTMTCMNHKQQEEAGSDSQSVH